MARLLFFAAALAVSSSAGCGASTATQERGPDTSTHPSLRTDVPAVISTIAVPQNPVDRHIRRALNLAITQDAHLQNRAISFIVTNGDVSVTGTVRTEDERRKINDMAMNIGGVKSVANALLIAE